MEVRMKAQISGTRNGAPWPAKGEVADVSAEEAAQLIAQGMAEPIDGDTDDAPSAPAGVEAIKAAVGDDVDLAQAALADEQAQAKPRKSLVAHLEKVIAAGSGKA